MVCFIAPSRPTVPSDRPVWPSRPTVPFDRPVRPLEKKCQNIKSGIVPFSSESSLWLRCAQVYRSIIKFHQGTISNKGNIKSTARWFGIRRLFHSGQKNPRGPSERFWLPSNVLCDLQGSRWHIHISIGLWQRHTRNSTRMCVNKTHSTQYRYISNHYSWGMVIAYGKSKGENIFFWIRAAFCTLQSKITIISFILSSRPQDLDLSVTGYFFRSLISRTFYDAWKGYWLLPHH